MSSSSSSSQWSYPINPYLPPSINGAFFLKSLSSSITMSSSWFSLPFFNSDDNNSPPHSPTLKPRFSLITQTIGRQLHNVASFLAPPPTTSLDSHDSGHGSPSSSTTSSYNGIKKDLAEIGTGLSSLLSSNKPLTQFSNFASNLLQLDVDHHPQVGITDEIIDFVRQISLRPEYWIDFPLSLQHKDYNISHVQKDHASAIQQWVPSLTTLRHTIHNYMNEQQFWVIYFILLLPRQNDDKYALLSTPEKDHASAIQQLVPSLTTLRHTIHNYMNEQQFWMIYFILLLPRLNDDEYALLSTPEIVQVREDLLQKLRNKKKTPIEFSDDALNEHPANKSLSEKGSHVNSTERVESSGETANATNKSKTDEDGVSFSDLEDGDNDLSGRLSGIRQTQSSRLSSASETSDWVRLNESSGTQSCERKARRPTYCEQHSESEESSDWLAIEDDDL